MNKKVIFGAIIIVSLSSFVFFVNKKSNPYISESESSTQSHSKLLNTVDSDVMTEAPAISKLSAKQPLKSLSNKSASEVIDHSPISNSAANSPGMSAPADNIGAENTQESKKLILVDPNSRLQYQHAFEEEPRNEVWADPTEQSIKDSLLNNQYGLRYHVEGIACKTSICIATVSVDMSKSSPELEERFGWYSILKSMRDSPVGLNIMDIETAIHPDPKNSAILIYETSFSKQ